MQLTSGAFGTPDPEAIYTLVYPAATTITQPNPVSPLLTGVQSCVAFGGYHNDVAVAGQSYAYAVIATCAPSADAVTEVISHEWIEAATDPLVTASSGSFMLTGGPQSAFFSVDSPHAIWAVMGGGEAGDLCENSSLAVIKPTEIGYAVQRTWSNAKAAGSHDPCVPSIDGAFFDSAPVLTETVTVSNPLLGTVTTLGVTIPVGMSKTIEVDLFSDAPTSGPWTVSADDVLSHFYSGFGLTKSMDFQWDNTTGQNGDKLHLTIKVTSPSLIAGAHAFMITSTLGNRSTIWPGVVVE
jgi:hypothetical protein